MLRAVRWSYDGRTRRARLKIRPGSIFCWRLHEVLMIKNHRQLENQSWVNKRLYMTRAINNNQHLSEHQTSLSYSGFVPPYIGSSMVPSAMVCMEESVDRRTKFSIQWRCILLLQLWRTYIIQPFVIRGVNHFKISFLKILLKPSFDPIIYGELLQAPEYNRIQYTKQKIWYYCTVISLLSND